MTDADVQQSLSGKRAVVIGGGITGLAAARVLSDRGARVTILERDADPPADDTTQAFESWQRRGAPQVRHSHAFLGRLRSLLRDHYPDLLAGLLAAGARELDMLARPPATLPPLQYEPGDEDFVALGCRRTTFEWVIRRSIAASGLVDLIGGAKVVGLTAADGAPPAVNGVRYSCGDEERHIAADLVVDASGRGSKAPAWLAALGATAPREEEKSSGVVYYTRFYRLRDGAEEPPPGPHPTAADYNWIKYAVFPADDRVFSITFAVPLAVPRLKILGEVGPFEAMVRALPGIAPWADPARAEPIGDAHRPIQAMGGLINRRREFVVDARPVATGFFPLGDAVYCTNPLYGRGCAQAFIHAHLMGESLDAHPGDLAAAMLALDCSARAAIEPFYRASVMADKDAVRKAEGRPARRIGNRLRAAFLEQGVLIGTRCDPVIFRAFLRMFNMFESPEKAFGSPRVIGRTLLVLARGKRFRSRFALPDPPDRETTIATCEASLGAHAA